MLFFPQSDSEARESWNVRETEVNLVATENLNVDVQK